MDGKRGLFIFLNFVCGSLHLVAASSSFNPIADTTITEGAPATGSSTVFIAGSLGDTSEGARARALLRFDLAEIPSNAVVSEVTLRVEVVKVPLTPQDSTFRLHRMLRDWDEIAADWEGPNAIETWGAIGGQPGSDFALVESSSVAISGVGSYTFSSSASLVADVRHWLTNRAVNFGWLLMTASEQTRFTARHFGSREGFLSLQPLLTIVYALEPVALTLSSPRRDGNQLQFDFTAQSDVAYRVEFKESLSVTNWQTLTNVALSPVTHTAVISDAISEPQRYYRVVVP